MPTRAPLIDRVRMVAVASLATGLAAGFALVALLGFGWGPELAGPLADGNWTARSRAWFTVRGIHGAEVRETGHHDTWTASSMRFTIPHLDRSRDHVLRFVISAARPEGVALPTLTIVADNVARQPRAVPNSFTTFEVTLPARADDRAVVILQASPTWSSGPEDTRQLGVQIREVALVSPSGPISSVWSVVGVLVLAVTCLSASLWWFDLPRGLAMAGSAGVASALTWFLWLDGAFLGPFPDDVLWVAITGVSLVAAVGAASAAWSGPGARWPAAVALVVTVTTVKLALFTHPLAIVGDGVFQVHRAQLVHAGQYYFTSITPRPFFEFPYAIALYVAAMPFWSWVPREIDRVWLLRVVTLVADAAAGLALYGVIVRAWSHRAALFVAALWPFARAPFEATSNANLTNAFGQGVFGIAMAALAWTLLGPRFRVGSVFVSAAVLAVAFLSHFSTLSVGVPLVGLVAVLVFVAAAPGQRAKGLWVGLVLLVAMAIAYAAYYRHFHAVYQQTVDRVLSEAPVETQGASIAASPLVKLRRWATGGSDDYGLPGLPLAVASGIGLVALVRHRQREVWSVVLGAWFLTWVVFTALGILTSVQMRVNLVAAPAFVCLGAYAMASACERSRIGRLAAVALAALVAMDGVRLWFVCLGV